MEIKNVTFKSNFVMIYTVHKILVLVKSNSNYLKNNIFEFC